VEWLKVNALSSSPSTQQNKTKQQQQQQNTTQSLTHHYIPIRTSTVRGLLWQHTPVIPARREAEVGGSLTEHGPRQKCGSLSENKAKRTGGHDSSDDRVISKLKCPSLNPNKAKKKKSTMKRVPVPSVDEDMELVPSLRIS
jgi:hypothetical protein